MKIFACRICVLAFVLLLTAANTPGDENSKAMLSWQDYKIISTRNIFSRNRLPANNSALSRSRQIPEREQKAESYLILRGITQKADHLVAFIEDSRTNRIKQIHEGEKIGNGKITDITIDFVTYKVKDSDIKVKTGMSMGGQDAGMTRINASGSGRPQQQKFMDISSDLKTDKPAAQQDEDTNAILQRLKERRKKELGE